MLGREAAPPPGPGPGPGPLTLPLTLPGPLTLPLPLPLPLPVPRSGPMSPLGLPASPTGGATRRNHAADWLNILCNALATARAGR